MPEALSRAARIAREQTLEAIGATVNEGRARLGMGTVEEAATNAAAREERSQAQEDAAAAEVQNRTDAVAALQQAIDDKAMTPGPQGERGLQGAKGDTGSAGATGDKGDTGAAGRNTSTSIAMGSVAIPAIVLGGNTTVVVPLSKAMSNPAYKYEWCPVGLNRGNLAVSEVSRTASALTLRIAPAGGITISAGGTIVVTAFEEV